MSVYLLDINVLIALADPLHTHHLAAHAWFSVHGSAWATCPLTENGFVRITSNPTYPNRPGDAVAVLQILRGLCQHKGHEFWADEISLRDLIPPVTAAMSHSQLTDVYLLGLAMHRQARLATLDRRLPYALLPGGSAALEVIRT